MDILPFSDIKLLVHYIEEEFHGSLCDIRRALEAIQIILVNGQWMTTESDEVKELGL